MNEDLYYLFIFFVSASIGWCIVVERRIAKLEQKLSDLCRSVTNIVKFLEKGVFRNEVRKDLFE